MSIYDWVANDQAAARERVRQEAVQYEQYRANLEGHAFDQSLVNDTVERFRSEQEGPARPHPAFDPGWGTR